jgi:hypothetical protein
VRQTFNDVPSQSSLGDSQRRCDSRSSDVVGHAAGRLVVWRALHGSLAGAQQLIALYADRLDNPANHVAGQAQPNPTLWLAHVGPWARDAACRLRVIPLQPLGRGDDQAIAWQGRRPS